MNMVAVCRQREITEHTFGGVIVFYINSNILLSIESNRISMNNGMFDFISFFSYYIKCLMIGLYIADIRARARIGEVELFRSKIIIAVFLIIHIIVQYSLSNDIETSAFLMTLVPVSF